MRLLFDVNHPVQAHLLRPVVAHFQARGDECLLVARDKDVTLRLLRGFGLEAEVLAAVGRGRLGALRELVQREWRLRALARAFRPAVIAGIFGAEFADSNCVIMGNFNVNSPLWKQRSRHSSNAATTSTLPTAPTPTSATS